MDMYWLFTGKSKEKDSENEKVISRPRNEKKTKNESLNDIMFKKHLTITMEIEEIDKKIRTVCKTNKKEAIKLLKKKKELEVYLGKLTTKKNNLDKIKDRKEDAIMNVEIIKKQKKEAEYIEKIYNNNNIKNVDEITDKISDTMLKARDIDNFISESQITFGEEEISDGDIENELDQIMEEQIREKEEEKEKEIKEEINFKIPKNEIKRNLSLFN